MTQDEKYHRAREDLFSRLGTAVGMILGAAMFAAAGWWFVISVAVACIVLAFVLGSRAVWKSIK